MKIFASNIYKNDNSPKTNHNLYYILYDSVDWEINYNNNR